MAGKDPKNLVDKKGRPITPERLAVAHALTGRPSTITEDVVAKLEAVFKLDVPIKVACSYAGISADAFFRRVKSDPDFASKMEAARNYARIAAGTVVLDAIASKDVSTAKWWLEKKHPGEFSSQPLVAAQFNSSDMKVEFILDDARVNDEDKTTS